MKVLIKRSLVPPRPPAGRGHPGPHEMGEGMGAREGGAGGRV